MMMKSRCDDVKLVNKEDWVLTSPGPSVWTGEIEKPKIDESPSSCSEKKLVTTVLWKNTNWRWTTGWIDLENTTVTGGDWVDFSYKDDSPASADAEKWMRPDHEMDKPPNPAEPQRFKVWNAEEEAAVKLWSAEEQAAYILRSAEEEKAWAPENN